ncbi:MAG: GreA/GreB family elongation factor [Candidatus Dojkabacteria bacterium]|nr:GreA/GreB family elongation factor [Candidatus Dojkabacteria bacterium]MDQ7020371.1 GreA/GreB family elongation factor [Candidatus Dojkabacteria bacterium]
MDNNVSKNIFETRLERLITMKEKIEVRLRMVNNESGEEAQLVQNRLRNEIEALDNSIVQLKERVSNDSSILRTVTISNGERVREVKIVNEELVDPKSGHVSRLSPLGRALSKAIKGENVDVTTPNGLSKTYTILSAS